MQGVKIAIMVHVQRRKGKDREKREGERKRKGPAFLTTCHVLGSLHLFLHQTEFTQPLWGVGITLLILQNKWGNRCRKAKFSRSSSRAMSFRSSKGDRNERGRQERQKSEKVVEHLLETFQRSNCALFWRESSDPQPSREEDAEACLLMGGCVWGLGPAKCVWGLGPAKCFEVSNPSSAC